MGSHNNKKKQIEIEIPIPWGWEKGMKLIGMLLSCSLIPEKRSFWARFLSQVSFKKRRESKIIDKSQLKEYQPPFKFKLCIRHFALVPFSDRCWYRV